jgi:hypothetical protein
MGPSGGSTAIWLAPAEDEGEAEFVGLVVFFGAGAAVTAVVSAAAGGVQVAVVATMAVAVSFTELTDAAFGATAICASTLTVCPAASGPTLHQAVPSPRVQPLLNVGFWLDGWAVSATDTSEVDPFFAATCTR